MLQVSYVWSLPFQLVWYSSIIRSGVFHVLYVRIFALCQSIFNICYVCQWPVHPSCWLQFVAILCSNRSKTDISSSAIATLFGEILTIFNGPFWRTLFHSTIRSPLLLWQRLLLVIYWYKHTFSYLSAAVQCEAICRYCLCKAVPLFSSTCGCLVSFSLRCVPILLVMCVEM